MTTALLERHETSALSTMDQETISKLVLNGDLSKLSPEQKVAYYGYRCQALNLDPATKPFDLLKLNGKEVLYATRECSNQISQRDGLSATVVKEEKVGDIYKVTARVTDAKGRQTDDVGCVSIQGLSGDSLCNAIMKATTKAKRRAILSHAGLGMMDETELETVHPQEPKHVPATVKPAAPAPEPLVVVEPPKSDFIAAAQEAHDKAKANGYQKGPELDDPPTPEEIAEIERIEREKDAKAAREEQRKVLGNPDIPLDADVVMADVVAYNANPKPLPRGGYTYGALFRFHDEAKTESWANTFHKDQWETAKLMKGKTVRLTYKYNGKYLNFYHVEKV